MLSAIYIKGFKTFARPVRMPLSGGVTAIVGPNGSGKSNITDAVLFALGEGSPSILRAGLMNDLIFSGSDSLPAVGVAEVTLVLDNSEGAISLPYEEVSLTRRISRSGETEYRINGTRARLIDVRTVAGEAGLGRHSILRQGAVDAIVAGGAAACRMALEEAAGLGVFRRRRVTASRKLERAAARLESSRRVEAELAAQLCRIEAEAVAAREYRELEARYRELSLAHLYRISTRDVNGGRERLADLEERVVALEARQEALREEGRYLEKEEKELEGRVRAEEETIRGLENDSETLRAEALRAERVFMRLEGGVWSRGAACSRLISDLEAGLDKIVSKTQQLNEDIGKLEEKHSQRKEAFRRMEELVARRRMDYAMATEKRTGLVGELEALRERLESLTDRLGEACALEDEDLARLGEIEEELRLYAPEELRVRGAAVLRRVEELREVAADRAAEADRRRGAIATLVGKTEAEIHTLRGSERAVAGEKRLYEVIRPRPGYEAAVEAALGDLAGGVLAETLGEGMRFLSGSSEERVVVRLDAEGIPNNGTPPGKPLLDCVEILDVSYAEALERLLEGAYVLENDEYEAPESGYDVAVTRKGLRLTRTSASRHILSSDFARRTRLAQVEKRLDVLKNQVGEKLYDLREDIFSVNGKLGEQAAQVDAFNALASWTARVARLLAFAAGCRARRAETSRRRRRANEEEIRRIQEGTFAVEDELREAREAEERAKEELDAALAATDLAYSEAREAAGRLARACTELQDARERGAWISRGLTGLKKTTATDAGTHRKELARRAVEQARRLDEATRKRLVRLRHSRSETAEQVGLIAERHKRLAIEAADVAGKLAGTTSEIAVLREELSRAKEAARAAEAEISEEWGATLETARRMAEALPETEDTERERARLARRLKNFGDVNLLALSQEGLLRERYEFVAAQRSDAEEAAAEIERIILNVDKEIETRFEATFQRVRRAFDGMVPRMIEGAAGELLMSEEGVDIGLRLKRRGWRPLRVLSGGERSLLALSFLFSIFLGRLEAGPRPFCMLDEAEAALDDINLARFLAVIDSYRSYGQFLLVTHQKRTMAAADVLYGVTPDASGATVVVSKRLTGE